MEDNINFGSTKTQQELSDAFNQEPPVQPPPVPSQPLGTSGNGLETPAKTELEDVRIEASQQAPSLARDDGLNQPGPPVPAEAISSDASVWEAAKARVMDNMTTSDHSETTQPNGSTPMRGGRSGIKASLATNGTGDGGGTLPFKFEADTSQDTPGSTGRGRGRGRGGGRPRGRGRGGGRSSKRKRGDDDDDDGASDSSDEVTPIATMTKSGRNVQKPTSFVPPPQSPSTNKPKRKYTRRNPQSAVCKTCLRGNSPASNMIVFCSGCDAPYHRYCHHPPIEQAVVDEIDKDWYCKHCESERVIAVPEADVADLVTVQGAPLEERQRYFSSLPPGMLVTLLTRATTLHPDLPVFTPAFRASIEIETPAIQPANGNGTPSLVPASHPNAPAKQPPAPPRRPQATRTSLGVSAPTGNPDPDEGYTPDVHPPNYPRPGQGLMRTLPPEQEDLQRLVEEDDRYGVFTHVYQVGHAPATVVRNGDVAQTNA